jgi:hypothetical protein
MARPPEAPRPSPAVTIVSSTIRKGGSQNGTGGSRKNQRSALRRLPSARMGSQPSESPVPVTSAAENGSSALGTSRAISVWLCFPSCGCRKLIARLPGTERRKTCSYDKPFFRGRVKTPPPPPDGDPFARNRAKGRIVGGKEKRFRSWEDIACDVCRITKEKCSGKMPCEHCFAKRVECSYKKFVNVVPQVFR